MANVMPIAPGLSVPKMKLSFAVWSRSFIRLLKDEGYKRLSEVFNEVIVKYVPMSLRSFVISMKFAEDYRNLVLEGQINAKSSFQ